EPQDTGPPTPPLFRATLLKRIIRSLQRLTSGSFEKVANSESYQRRYRKVERPQKRISVGAISLSHGRVADNGLERELGWTRCPHSRPRCTARSSGAARRPAEVLSRGRLGIVVFRGLALPRLLSKSAPRAAGEVALPWHRGLAPR